MERSSFSRASRVFPLRAASETEGIIKRNRALCEDSAAEIKPRDAHCAKRTVAAR